MRRYIWTCHLGIWEHFDRVAPASLKALFAIFGVKIHELIDSLVLEIGVFIGFSTMCWAEAVGPDGHVTGLEFAPEYAKISEEAFATNNIKNIDIIVGDAKESYVCIFVSWI